MSNMYMTIEEYMRLEPCGSVHPNHPDVICVKKGECLMDWHMAERTILANNRYKYTQIVQWGKALESFVATFGGPIVGELLPIKHEQNVHGLHQDA